MNNNGRCSRATRQRLTNTLWRAAIFCAFFSVVCVDVHGQALTSLSGSVSDPTGAVVPNVSITLEDTRRGLSRPAVSDEVGRYGFPQVLPGRYRLVVKAPGFADVVIDPVELAVNTPATVNITLQQLRGVTET